MRLVRIGYGILHLLFATGSLTAPSGAFPALGFWFIALAWITTMGAIAATVENMALTAVLGTLAAGSVLVAIAELLGGMGWAVAAGYVFIVSAVCAWYTASALMFESVSGRAVLPVGKTRQDPAGAGGSRGQPGRRRARRQERPVASHPEPRTPHGLGALSYAGWRRRNTFG